MQLTIQVSEEVAKIIIQAGDLVTKRGGKMIELEDFLNLKIKVDSKPIEIIPTPPPSPQIEKVNIEPPKVEGSKVNPPKPSAYKLYKK